MKLVWRDDALEDIEAIVGYISERNSSAAERLADRIQSCAERLVRLPFAYRVGRAPGTREAVVHPNYIMIYTVTRDAVENLNIVHSRQRYP